MSMWCGHIHVRLRCFILTEACSCRLELAYLTEKISKNSLVCKNAVALAFYGSCRLLVMGSWRQGLGQNFRGLLKEFSMWSFFSSLSSYNNRLTLFRVVACVPKSLTWFSVISPLLSLSWSLKNSVVRIPFLWIASLIFSNISCKDGVPGR